MLTPYLPYPPASGGQIRTLYLLKYLARNHSITLVSLYKDEKEKEYAQYLKSYCKEIHLCKRASKPWQFRIIAKALFSTLPFLIVRNYSPEAATTIDKLLNEKEFDVIHAETFYIMPHIPETEIPILLVEQTIEYKVYQHYIASLPAIIRLPLLLDIMKLKSSETYYWHKANQVATVSEFDKGEIKSIAPNIDPVIIPNGAGDEMFVHTLPDHTVDEPTILFIGNFFWLQNVEATQYLIEHIFPQLVEKIPNIKLIVAGQNISEKLIGIKHKSIIIKALAPDDELEVKRLYQSSTLFLAPIFGPGGTRLKILASMAAGLPVISTDIGIEGLDLVDGKHVLVARTPQEFVNQSVKILSDRSLYASIQKNAYLAAKERFSWKNIAKKLENVYKDII